MNPFYVSSMCVERWMYVCIYHHANMTVFWDGLFFPTTSSSQLFPSADPRIAKLWNLSLFQQEVTVQYK